ncbi:NDR1/HIN1-like protein 10 [Nymphaea colorata]|uniref:NDR1/HIN1-like protein 10 n=1 Tax=Nymphaea colorata TaxID=210225 RepID=UPI00129D4FA6|nr:NDR1/HIN1-like protein 10 [Nymphaea colorata]
MPSDRGQVEKQANPMKQSSSPPQSTAVTASEHHNHQLYHDNCYVKFNGNHGRILSLLLKFVLAFSVILCFGDLIVMLLLRPAMVEVSFEKASLTKFSITNKNILNFNLALDVRVRSPNKKIGIYYESLEAVAFYRGERLGSVSVPSFYQEPENTTYVHPVFRGRFPAGLGYGVFRDYINGRHQRWFQVDVKFFTKLWLKIGPLSAGRYEPEVNCPLLVHLGSVTSSKNAELKWSRFLEEKGNY